jgi:hypothetical protein
VENHVFDLKDVIFIGKLKNGIHVLTVASQLDQLLAVVLYILEAFIFLVTIDYILKLLNFEKILGEKTPLVDF